MSRYYAVYRGHKTGIFNDWLECKRNISDYPNPIYKLFNNVDEAKEFLKTLEYQENLRLRQINIQEGKIKPEDIPNKYKSNIIYKYVVYVSGLCKNGIGGYGIIVVNNITQAFESPTNVHIVRSYKGLVPYVDCTSNKAQLYVILKALSEIKSKYLLKSTSQYAINCVSGIRYINKWRKNGWKTVSGKSIENRELIEAIDNQLEKPITYTLCDIEQKRDIKLEYLHNQNEYYHQIAYKLAINSLAACNKNPVKI
jgi:ribonuclease HI